MLLLQPIAEWFGLEFPDRIVNVTDRRGCKVGQCKEATKISGASSVNKHVLLMRHHDKGHIPSHFHETKPEKVLAYRRRMYVLWPHVDPQLQARPHLSSTAVLLQLLFMASWSEA